MSEKQVNSNGEWLMFVVGKGKVKLLLVTQPLTISLFHTLYGPLCLNCLITPLSSYSNLTFFPFTICLLPPLSQTCYLFSIKFFHALGSLCNVVLGLNSSSPSIHAIN